MLLKEKQEILIILVERTIWKRLIAVAGDTKNMKNFDK